MKFVRGSHQCHIEIEISRWPSGGSIIAKIITSSGTVSLLLDDTKAVTESRHIVSSLFGNFISFFPLDCLGA